MRHKNMLFFLRNSVNRNVQVLTVCKPYRHPLSNKMSSFIDHCRIKYLEIHTLMHTYILHTVYYK